MTLYKISWYPKCGGDCEKETTLVLCNDLREARKVAKERFASVRVAYIEEYGKGEEYWASYVVWKDVVYSYDYYRRHIVNQ